MIQLDVIALCCEFTEYENRNEMETELELTSDEIAERTGTLIWLKNGGVIVEVF